MKTANVLLPVAVAAAVVGAYFAGQYVGRSDAERRFALAAQLVASSESANRLFVAGAVADLLKDSKPTEALRVTEQYASIQVGSVQECLAQPSCSWWAATSSERRNRLLALVARYGGSTSVSNSK